jgi:hypothetical protein
MAWHNFFLVLSLVMAADAFGAESDGVTPWRQDQPRTILTRLRKPSANVDTRGLHCRLVASEPDIVNPIAMTFDDRGRIWITESVEYPRKPAGVGRDG